MSVVEEIAAEGERISVLDPRTLGPEGPGTVAPPADEDWHKPTLTGGVAEG